MATRQSARIRNPPAQVSVVAEPPAAANVAPKKRKLSAAAGKGVSASEGSSSAAKKKKSTVVKGKKGKAEEREKEFPQNKISALPLEVLNMVLDNIKEPSEMSSLGRTCKSLYTHMMPRLYGRVAVAAMFHAHIAKLIRTLEPHLTIAQKKQLKKEGQYRGQQERYPSGLDEKVKPICATYVRQLVVGVADPGRKHKYIVDRYVEEALKNMSELEIIETHVYTESIGKSIASLKNLKAIRLIPGNDYTNSMAPLALLKNIRHLDVQPSEYIAGGDFLPSILKNSRTTLESLILYNGIDFQNLDLDDEPANDSDAPPPYLTALKSLTLSGFRLSSVAIDGAKALKSLCKTINFIALKELVIQYHDDENCLFLPHLTSLFASALTTNTPIHLRTLQLKMSDHSWNHTGLQHTADLTHKCNLISSFNTLTSLHLPDYGQYPSSNPVNPGLAPIFLNAILKHVHLRSLRISYIGVTSSLKIPYLSAYTVGRIVDALPELRDFEFAPEESQMDAISAALAKSKTLQTITCFPHDSWVNHVPMDNRGHEIVISILKAFLLASPDTGVSDSITLKKISLSWIDFDIASSFSKQKGKGKGKRGSEVFTVSEGGKTVCFRQAVEVQRIHVGYDPEFKWVEKVAGEMRGQA